MKYLQFLIVAIGLTAASACGNKGPELGEMAPVSGKVTVDGKAVTAGQVSFIAIDSSTATGGSVVGGQIDSSGEYVMHTAGKKGAPVGRYKVVVVPSMVPSGESKMPVSPFHSKFSSADKTPLIVKVEQNAPAGTYDLKLTAK